jgi:transcriptional regulator with XRE-family HTH domain
MDTQTQLGITRFRQWRLSKGLTYRRAAEVLGVTEQQIYWLDSGQRPLRLPARLLMNAYDKGIEPEPWNS